MVADLKGAKDLLDHMAVGYSIKAVQVHEQLAVRLAVKVPEGAPRLGWILIPTRSETPAVLVFAYDEAYLGTYWTKEDKFVTTPMRDVFPYATY